VHIIHRKKQDAYTHTYVES